MTFYKNFKPGGNYFLTNRIVMLIGLLTNLKQCFNNNFSFNNNFFFLTMNILRKISAFQSLINISTAVAESKT